MRKIITTMAVCALAAGLAGPAFAGDDKDLIRAVAKAANIPEYQARKALEGVVGYIVADVKAGRKVYWSDLGSFEPKKVPPQKGIDPKTKKKIKVPAQLSVQFIPSIYLRMALGR
jgi:DNA-binding protein HU-beta